MLPGSLVVFPKSALSDLEQTWTPPDSASFFQSALTLLLPLLTAGLSENMVTPVVISFQIFVSE